MAVLHQDAWELPVASLPSAAGDTALGQPLRLQALDGGSEQSVILGFSERTVNKKAHCAPSGLIVSHMGKERERQTPLRLLSVQLGTSGVWLLGAPGLSSSSAPRCSSLVGTKKSFSRLRLDRGNLL